MADILVANISGGGTLRLKDMGDGTYAPVGYSAASLADALDEDIDAMAVYLKGADYTSCTADQVVSNAPICLVGYYVMASSSGVINLFDNASAASGTTLLATAKSIVAGDSVQLNVPINTKNGLYFDLVSGTATVLVLTRKLTAA